jgi:hypothetical protein
MEAHVYFFVAAVVCFILIVACGVVSSAYAVSAARLRSPHATFWEAIQRGAVFNRALFTDEGWIQARLAQKTERQGLFFVAGFVICVLVGGLLKHFQM